MSADEDKNKAPPATTNSTNENELDNLVSQLRKGINKSDWLVHNTSAKWEAENPDLAKQWREAIKTVSSDKITEQ